jgi:hypothetical protein
MRAVAIERASFFRTPRESARARETHRMRSMLTRPAIEANKLARTSATRTPPGPRNPPAPQSSFTSPNPIASRPKTRLPSQPIRSSTPPPASIPARQAISAPTRSTSGPREKICAATVDACSSGTSTAARGASSMPPIET